jgi:hypothetical protein
MVVLSDQLEVNSNDKQEPVNNKIKQALFTYQEVAANLRRQYYQLVVVEVLRSRLRSTENINGFPSSVELDFRKNTDWAVLEMFVEKVVEMAVLFDPETALNHLAKRIGDGPITAVDTGAVVDISEVIEASSDIGGSTDVPHDVTSDSILESLDMMLTEEEKLMESLKSSKEMEIEPSEIDFEDTNKSD